jgi:hypothetical protein
MGGFSSQTPEAFGLLVELPISALSCSSSQSHPREPVAVADIASFVRVCREVTASRERRAADFDATVLLQSQSPASRLTLGAQTVSWRADHRPERSRSDVVEPSRCCWPKLDSIPEREPSRGAAANIIALTVRQLTTRSSVAKNAVCAPRLATSKLKNGQ